MGSEMCIRDRLDGDRVTNLADILSAADPEVSQFGDVAEAFFTRHTFDESTELLSAGYAAFVDLAFFDLGTATAEGIDFRNRAVHGVRVVRVDEHLAGVVIGDVNLSAGRFYDAADGLTTRSDEKTDLLWVDLDGLDARREGAEVLARSRDGLEHLLQDGNSSVATLVDRLLGDVVRQALDLQIELEARDTFGGASDLEVHVSEVIFLTEDVGDGFPLAGSWILRVLTDKTTGDTGNRSDDWHTSVHEGQAAATDRGLSLIHI